MRLASNSVSDILAIKTPDIGSVEEWTQKSVSPTWKDRTANSIATDEYGLGLLRGDDEETPVKYKIEAYQKERISKRGIAEFFPIFSFRTPDAGFEGRGHRRFMATVWPRNGAGPQKRMHGVVYWCENLKDARLLQIAHATLNLHLAANIVSSSTMAIIGGSQTFYQSVVVNPLGVPLKMESRDDKTQGTIISMLASVIIKGMQGNTWVALRNWGLDLFRIYRKDGKLWIFPAVLEDAVIYDEKRSFAVYADKGADERYLSKDAMKRTLRKILLKADDPLKEYIDNMDLKKFVMLLEIMELSKSVDRYFRNDYEMVNLVFQKVFKSIQKKDIVAYSDILEKLKSINT
jgi:hypothetical protein